MYFGDKEALEELKNYTVCVRTDNGIRNLASEHDIMVENLVFVSKLPSIYEGKKIENSTIYDGEMVRYRSLEVILR